MYNDNDNVIAFAIAPLPPVKSRIFTGKLVFIQSFDDDGWTIGWGYGQ